jgi:hypothetical protein
MNPRLSAFASFDFFSSFPLPAARGEVGLRSNPGEGAVPRV